MDMFMDKLAQKLTAQDIIKANTAADVEELNRLKNQIAEYNECLVKLQKLIDDGAARLSGMRAEESGTARALEESADKAEALRQSVEGLGRQIAQQQERLEGTEKAVAGEVDALAGDTGEKLEALSETTECRLEALRDRTEALAGILEEKLEAQAAATEALNASVGEKIDQLCGQLEAQASGGLTERLDTVEENVHKECVKVYRNVQAVMVEESGRQGEALAQAKADVAGVRGKLGAVLGVSVAAMVISLAGLVLQILDGLNIKLF